MGLFDNLWGKDEKEKERKEREEKERQEYERLKRENKELELRIEWEKKQKLEESKKELERLRKEKLELEKREKKAQQEKEKMLKLENKVLKKELAKKMKESTNSDSKKRKSEDQSSEPAKKTKAVEYVVNHIVIQHPTTETPKVATRIELKAPPKMKNNEKPSSTSVKTGLETKEYLVLVYIYCNMTGIKGMKNVKEFIEDENKMMTFSYFFELDLDQDKLKKIVNYLKKRELKVILEDTLSFKTLLQKLTKDFQDNHLQLGLKKSLKDILKGKFNQDLISFLAFYAISTDKGNKKKLKSKMTDFLADSNRIKSFISNFELDQKIPNTSKTYLKAETIESNSVKIKEFFEKKLETEAITDVLKIVILAIFGTPIKASKESSTPIINCTLPIRH